MLFERKDGQSVATVCQIEGALAADSLALHGFRTLLGDLATLTRNTLATKGDTPATFTAYATPMVILKKAFKLLGVKQT